MQGGGEKDRERGRMGRKGQSGRMGKRRERTSVRGGGSYVGEVWIREKREEVDRQGGEGG